MPDFIANECFVRISPWRRDAGWVYMAEVRSPRGDLLARLVSGGAVFRSFRDAESAGEAAARAWLDDRHELKRAS